MVRTALFLLAGALLVAGSAGAFRSCQAETAERTSAEPAPGYGGRAIVHLAGMPRSLNYALESSAYVRRILFEVHEFLLLEDWETWEHRPALCHRWDEEDMLVLTDEGRAKHGDEVTQLRVRAPTSVDDAPAAGTPDTVEVGVLYGSLAPEEGGWAIAPLSAGNPLSEPIFVPEAEVARVERRAVFTFHLREDVRWQPSLVFRDRTDIDEEHERALAEQRLDARDVRFSWSIYANPDVDCGEKRFQVAKMPRCDVVDPHTVRIFYESQYFKALDAIGTTLTILPSHVYDLSDPDNPDHDPDATAAEQAKHVNENPHNRLWVGLGPYQVHVYDTQSVEARRFDGYFDPERAGHLDVIRWRHIQSDDAAFQALRNGEIDFIDRITSENYLGDAMADEEFTREFQKGHYYLGSYTYTCWNLRRPQLADHAVRLAIAHAFDAQEFLAGYYKGLGRVITGPFPYDSPTYDRSVAPIAYDPARALELLEDAGWYDRDGNGVRDRDGVELEFEYLLTSGNVAMQALSEKLQESLGRLGIRMHIAQVVWPALQERLRDRDFDATSLAWVPPLESDPEMIWHSAGAAEGSRSSNYAGLVDAEVDALIARGQRELDRDARHAVWRALHARLYALQPYLWHYNLPTKYALRADLVGFRSYAIDPGYSIRDWHYPLGAPGTRATLQR